MAQHPRTDRADIRVNLAFWAAQDRRSVTPGPPWLWRGRLTGPIRDCDLPAGTAAKIRTRRAAGIAPERLYSAPGPRRLRLPAAITRRRAAVLIAAAAAIGVLAWQLGPGYPGPVAVAVMLAGALAAAGTAVAAADLWARCDPRRLTPAELRQVGAATRQVDWHPLAGSGPVSRGGAFMLEALQTCSDIAGHPAWALPAAEPLRWQIDLDEEIFQIGRAAAALDRVTAVDDPIAQRSAGELAEALLDRLVALHRCQASLTDLHRSAQPASGPDATGPAVTALVSAVESDMATQAWGELNDRLLATIDGYAALTR
jgi:hypothetical protein